MKQGLARFVLGGLGWVATILVISWCMSHIGPVWTLVMFWLVATAAIVVLIVARGRRENESPRLSLLFEQPAERRPPGGPSRDR